MKAGRVDRTCIATDDVVPTAAGIIGIVDAKLSVIEDVEKVRVKIELTKFGEFEVLDQAHVKIQATRIVQEISASIAKGQSPGRYKLRGIPLERAKALSIVRRLGSPYVTSG